MIKKCSTCKIEKELDQFGHLARSLDGYNCNCFKGLGGYCPHEKEGTTEDKICVTLP